MHFETSNVFNLLMSTL